MDKLNNGHIVIAATNRYDRLDPALLRRFSVHHEITTLSIDERVCMIRQFLDSADIQYDTDNIWDYAADDKSQAEIMNDMVRAIADSLMEGTEFRLPCKE